jgi:hypothetical protein
MRDFISFSEAARPFAKAKLEAILCQPLTGKLSDYIEAGPDGEPDPRNIVGVLVKAKVDHEVRTNSMTNETGVRDRISYLLAVDAF